MIKILTPFILFNNFAGIVGLIWLFYLGEVKFALLAIFSLLFTKMFLGLTMFPALLSMPLAQFLMEKKQKLLTIILASVQLAYTQFIMTGWVVLIFMGVILYATKSNFFMGSFIPYLLVGYGIALRPIQSLADEDFKAHGGFESFKTAFLLAIAYISSFVIFIFFGLESHYVFIPFVTVGCLNFLYDLFRVILNFDQDMKNPYI